MTRRILAAVALACALATLALGLVYAGGRSPGPLDVVPTAGLGHGLLSALVLPTEPYVLLPAIAVIAGTCLYRRRPADALLAVLSPAIAVALTTWVLKPLFDREKDATLVYPSGHTVSLVAVLVVLVLLARRKTAAAAFGVVLLACATAGLTGLGYHYLTDVAGGTFFGTAVVTGLRAVTPRRAPARSAG
ncbi:phosphatase PAP2 family protein [Amycolatopsis sp. PS_44_ISF1]|uniref:phosphatase PAP2 family protein n=1 Tax=Amycolatopsis sp. PS_44_ISF1 TaxID=2974917 RepID=UPI0028DE3E61|nr:phosphatase PAP2 family protein [Amycolatopsis sp. PS_44_ISF1]MDT8914053.1 phosphatase PAP2 family protein [Amycolatopsis sp. PS_44_ISF1]